MTFMIHLMNMKCYNTHLAFSLQGAVGGEEMDTPAIKPE